MNKVKKIINHIPLLNKLAHYVVKIYVDAKLYSVSLKRIKKNLKNRGRTIFYLGIPVHTNLGDLAQGVCIREWIKKNYPDCTVIEIETNAIVNTKFSVLKNIKKYYKVNDFIVFQSGYTTTDLGGFADEMHKSVMQSLPEAKMLMMPQTIFFKSEDRKRQTADCYNSMKHMLFLARDRVSYGMAKEMFPDIPVRQFPDIVTTFIGKYSFNYKREGILFCRRNDSEKYYSDEEIASLIEKCKSIADVEQTDTTKSGRKNDIVKNAKQYIESELDRYAHYKLIITDRYHGTILSLVAGTPVIIIKTNDHKVVTGAEWFKGVYDDYVYLADSLEDSYRIAKKLYFEERNYQLEPYFERAYYDKLPTLF